MDINLILRIIIAALLGGIIGLEREYRAKEAGFRTHFLVGLGSALFMVVSQYGFEHILATQPNVSLDPSRIASQVVSGIGFIGAGTIIFQNRSSADSQQPPVYGQRLPSVWPVGQACTSLLWLQRSWCLPAWKR